MPPLTVLSSSRFSTVGAPSALAIAGHLYYEVTLTVVGESPQVGWVTAEFNNIDQAIEGNGVGDCAHSWGADGARMIKWHDGEAPWSVEWRDGDVVGVAADASAGRLLFARNGTWDETFTITPGTGIYPAFSTQSSTFVVNLGDEPFRYPPPEGFQPVPLVGHDLVLLRGPPLHVPSVAMTELIVACKREHGANVELRL